MRSFVRRISTGLARCSSGNATMMTALGLPALLGAAGYGVDTAQMYMWKRELQHSVDQAAIGGAWALAYSQDDEFETRAEQEFFSNLNVTANMVKGGGPEIGLASYDNGVGNSVLVSATVVRPLPFMGMLLNQTATVSATAQAAFEAGVPYNACLMTLKDDGTTFTVAGSATVHANCGLGALSCSDDAIDIQGGTVTTTSIVACGTVKFPDGAKMGNGEPLASVIKQSPEGYDEYGELPIPKPDGATPSRTSSCTGNGKNAVATPQPGLYAGGITISCKSTFAPGIYFIDGGTLDLTYNGLVVANKVMFILRKGATLRLSGMGNSAAVTMSPMEEGDLAGTPYAADSEALAGMLVIEDKTNVNTAVNHQINGNAKLSINGVFYLPNGNVTVNGNANARNTCFQISSYTLTITGHAYLETLCDYDESTEFGTGDTGVRLVT